MLLSSTKSDTELHANSDFTNMTHDEKKKKEGNLRKCQERSSYSNNIIHFFLPHPRKFSRSSLMHVHLYHSTFSSGPCSFGFPFPICRESSSLPQLIDPFQGLSSAPTICREESHSRNLREMTSNSLLLNSVQKVQMENCLEVLSFPL